MSKCYRMLTGGGKTRNSNLELYRIIVMLLIVAHHYVVNSELWTLMQDSPLTGNSIFLYLFGMWGKTGINCFVLITGYFMCKSKATIGKFLKLLLEVFFYEVLIYFVFLATGVVDFSFEDCLKAFIPLGDVGTGFTTSFIFFYLFIPFLNILIQNIDKRKHLLLIALCLFIYTVWNMSPFEVGYNYVSWFSILYLIASYIRFYPNQYDADVSFWRNLMVCCFVVSCLTVIVGAWFKKGVYFFVSDCYAIMAVLTSVCAFMYFKNLKIRQSRIINMMGASTFGVLLIHANSDAMRQWLWKDTLDNTAWIGSPYLWMHAVLSVIGIFVTCVIIDQLRINFIEQPFFDSRVYRRMEILIIKQIKLNHI